MITMGQMLSLYDEDEDYDDDDEFHAVFTVQLGELMHDGLVDFNDGTWDTTVTGGEIKWYSEEQKKRLYNKISSHFYYREIGELPYRRWKNDLLNKLATIMPKYNFIYAALDDGVTFLQLQDVYAKHRNIYSDFPQTLLSGNEDYASSGNDNESESVTNGNFIALVNKLRETYSDPDLLVIHELDTMFWCVLSSNMNGI